MVEVEVPKTYMEVGVKEGLTGEVLKMYVNYMTIRWAKEEEDHCRFGYSHEWAGRFMHHAEFGASDLHGQAVLYQFDFVRDPDDGERIDTSKYSLEDIQYGKYSEDKKARHAQEV